MGVLLTEWVNLFIRLPADRHWGFWFWGMIHLRIECVKLWMYIGDHSATKQEIIVNKPTKEIKS